MKDKKATFVLEHQSVGVLGTYEMLPGDKMTLIVDYPIETTLTFSDGLGNRENRVFFRYRGKTYKCIETVDEFR